MHSWPCRHGLGWELIAKAEPGEEGERETADREEAETEGKVQDTQGSGSGEGGAIEGRVPCARTAVLNLPGVFLAGMGRGPTLAAAALFHLMVTVGNDPPQCGLA